MTALELERYNKDNELTPSQRTHNMELDMKINEARNYNKMMDELDKYKIASYKKFLEDNPNYLLKSVPGLSMTRKTVIGIRYVK